MKSYMSKTFPPVDKLPNENTRRKKSYNKEGLEKWRMPDVRIVNVGNKRKDFLEAS